MPRGPASEANTDTLLAAAWWTEVTPKLCAGIHLAAASYTLLLLPQPLLLLGLLAIILLRLLLRLLRTAQG
jgi:hypothetical protein